MVTKKRKQGGKLIITKYRDARGVIRFYKHRTRLQNIRLANGNIKTIMHYDEVR